uniref:Methyltransferase domain-containing protein n=1 Tax=Chromera velia CCMP2878 TaxID=1169474 RepID=A0A0G4H9X1_9ALVE|eukprot:Cvel_25543.t1-p1 / transcript=Cvel_25543.t1 / gene=Cvel_25543 / organism=Chromera_velia_CCMP2878 / gene_product=hypothetical protein / transcript_product=hypothetical protein / location=Cvel_scaffold2907:20142-20876(-) / protein_length=245 / sequence_SO=supercontig / SO=protein_coding / is_pseudo=false
MTQDHVCPTGARRWECSHLLETWLKTPEALARGVSARGRLVVELGAGTGCLSLACVEDADLGARRALVTDLRQRIEETKLLVSANGRPGSAKCVFKELAWSEKFNDKAAIEVLGEDAETVRESGMVLLLCELLYWPALDLFDDDTLDALACTLHGFMLAGAALEIPGGAVGVVCYRERDKGRETRFLDLCREKGLVVEEEEGSCVKEIWDLCLSRGAFGENPEGSTCLEESPVHLFVIKQQREQT